MGIVTLKSTKLFRRTVIINIHARFNAMKIVVATPLYPPDIAPPAPYVKELAKRLATRHIVTIVAYAHIPELVENVTIVPIDKRQPLLARLFGFTRALMREAKNADVIFVMNGASVELPAILLSLMSSTPWILGIADLVADGQSEKRFSLHLIDRIARAHAKKTLTEFPLPRPEILPLEAYPEAELQAYEESWQHHLEILEETFCHDS